MNMKKGLVGLVAAAGIVGVLSGCEGVADYRNSSPDKATEIRVVVVDSVFDRLTNNKTTLCVGVKDRDKIDVYCNKSFKNKAKHFDYRKLIKMHTELKSYRGSEVKMNVHNDVLFKVTFPDGTIYDSKTD